MTLVCRVLLISFVNSWGYFLCWWSRSQEIFASANISTHFPLAVARMQMALVCFKLVFYRVKGTVKFQPDRICHFPQHHVFLEEALSLSFFLLCLFFTSLLKPKYVGCLLYSLGIHVCLGSNLLFLLLWLHVSFEILLALFLLLRLFGIFYSSIWILAFFF